MLVVVPKGAVPLSLSAAEGVNGLLSVPFGLPSPSQSAASQVALGTFDLPHCNHYDH
ncbi:MAG: hypothetical protein IPO48_21120 [Saprospiraceae bacterium]|nr:hypothetical protein [Saprospiraceae bacterium]